MKVHLREMVKRDMEGVLAMECVENPCWCRDDYDTLLRRRNAAGMVAEQGDMIHGVMVYIRTAKRIEIKRFLVDRDSRRKTVGTQMFYKLADKLAPQRRTKLVFSTSEYETPGHLFLRGMGCICTGVHRGVFDGADEYRFVFKIKEGVGV